MAKKKDTVISKLIAMSEDEMISVWGTLNRWEWPSEFGDALKPIWWDGFPSLTSKEIYARKFGFCAPTCDYIESIIRQKRIIQTLNERETHA